MDFSDVLIVPQSSDLKSRSEVDVERTFFLDIVSDIGGGFPLPSPIWIQQEH